MTIVGRYAPSPTGALHVGNVRTALLAWLDVRSLGGRFILRMENLDPMRSSDEAAQGIVEDLRWLGLDWDEGPDVGGAHGPYVQSQRGALYRSAAEGLVESGLAFRCSCSRAEVARAANAPHAGEDGPRYPGSCRQGALHPERPQSTRLVVGPGSAPFLDLLHGPQSFDVAAAVGDFIVARADGVAAYQLAVMLDDALMGVTRVMRGDDLLASTPRQLLVARALGLTPPAYGHVPLMLGEDGHRLAKRGGALSLQALRAAGVRPEAVVGFLARSAGLEIPGPVSARELVRGFSLDRLSRRPAVVTGRDIEALVG
jgi:glutamyl-tRNA synthetase